MFYTNKAIIILSIRTRRPRKYQQILVEKQPDPETNLNKASGIWLIPGYDKMVQYIRPINESRLQYIFALEFKYAHNKACVL